MILAGYLNTILHAVLDPYFELILDYYFIAYKGRLCRGDQCVIFYEMNNHHFANSKQKFITISRKIDIFLSVYLKKCFNKNTNE